MPTVLLQVSHGSEHPAVIEASRSGRSNYEEEINRLLEATQGGGGSAAALRGGSHQPCPDPVAQAERPVRTRPGTGPYGAERQQRREPALDVPGPAPKNIRWNWTCVQPAQEALYGLNRRCDERKSESGSQGIQDTRSPRMILSPYDDWELGPARCRAVWPVNPGRAGDDRVGTNHPRRPAGAPIGIPCLGRPPYPAAPSPPLETRPTAGSQPLPRRWMPASLKRALPPQARACIPTQWQRSRCESAHWQ